MANGWIILDKGPGLFSRTAGAKVAHLFGEKKFGHIGTLDPMATGVLPIAIGNATKMIPFIEDAADATKEYLFSCVFGFETDTLDATGHIIKKNGIIPTTEQVLSVLPEFIGNIKQVPPIYSAIHVNGARAYEIARQNIDTNIELAPRDVTIYSLELLGVDGDTWTFSAQVSRGTYVRSIARDIANKCGTFATVNMLRRTKTNGFSINNALKLDFLENLFNNGGDFKKLLGPVDLGLGDIPVLNLDGKSAELYRCGGFIKVNGTDGLRRVYDGDVFVGIGNVTNGQLCPKRTI